MGLYFFMFFTYKLFSTLCLLTFFFASTVLWIICRCVLQSSLSFTNPVHLPFPDHPSAFPHTALIPVSYSVFSCFLALRSRLLPHALPATLFRPNFLLRPHPSHCLVSHLAPTLLLLFISVSLRLLSFPFSFFF